MAQLEPAGVFGGAASFLFPKKLTAEIRTETLPNGQVQLTPTYFIDGREVPPDLVGRAPTQIVLGYRVVLDNATQQVHRTTLGRQTRLSKRRAGEFLSALVQSEVPVRSSDGKRLARITEAQPDVSLRLDPDDSLSVKSELVTKDGVALEKPQSIDQLKQENGWCTVGDDLHRIPISNSPLDKVLLQNNGNGHLSGNDVPRFLKLLEEKAHYVGSVERNERLQPLSILHRAEHFVKVDGDADSISISPALAFAGTQGGRYEIGAEALQQFDGKKGAFCRVSEGWAEITPDALEKHEKARQELQSQFPRLDNIVGQDIPAALNRLSEANRRRAPSNTPWAVYFSDAVRNSHRIVDGPSTAEFALNIVERDGRALLSLDPMYSHDRFLLSHDEVRAAVEADQEWVRHGDAWIKVDSAKYDSIKAGADRLRLQRDQDGYIFPASEREKVVGLFSVLGSIQHSAAYADFLVKLADFEKIEDVPLPTTLKSSIRFRAYQKHGYNWLAFLHRFGLNGILADDMGLGKTLQTLAVIERAKGVTKSAFPSLIVCPTSVVNNWKNEVAKFFHNCEVIVYTGDGRERKLQRLQRSLESRDLGFQNRLVITSYDVARIDRDQLNRVPWLYVVVDEGHNIKNPDAKRTKAIKTINGQNKLALTGTPIQNNLEELWSLFDYAMPGYLGSRSEFQKKYGRKGRINMDAVLNGKSSLKDRIRPFVLRRLKEKVAQDLPRKMIVPHEVELTPLQVSLYKQAIGGPEYKRMIEEIDKNGVQRSKLHIFAVLAKLRAICNHPVLAQQNRPPASARFGESGKLEALKELMEEIVDGEHRALLFSQSTRMLDIIQHFFKEWGVKSVRLDGSTPADARGVLVDEFNNNSAIHCFLLSTKAGGTGLNLTGADTVIFYDHDWNPANDNQAQDRAHRIGQTKPVTVYKLVSKGTIEEKILERQAKKQLLADQIIGADEAGFKDLTKEELLGLFRLDDDVNRD